jgi:acyl-CoA thioester hydrolase
MARGTEGKDGSEWRGIHMRKGRNLENKGARMAMHRKVTRDLHLRFRDVDAMGHVNNAVYFTFFEEGRKAFLEEVLSIVEPPDYPFILAHMSCDYLKPMKLGDSPVIKVWIGKVGAKSFTFRYHIVGRDNESEIFARGESVMVLFDYDENRSLLVSPEFLERIRDYCES